MGAPQAKALRLILPAPYAHTVPVCVRNEYVKVHKPRLYGLLAVGHDTRLCGDSGIRVERLMEAP